MSEAVAKLMPLVNALTVAERAELSDRLAALNGEQGAEELTEDEWEAEVAELCDKRLADLAAGRTTLIPGDEVMKRLKERFG